MNNQDIPGCSKDSDIKTRKRKLKPLKQSELENSANNPNEVNDLEDPYPSDDSVYDKVCDSEDASEIDESKKSLDCDSQLDENETVPNTIADQRHISDEELWVSENEEPPEIAFLSQPCYNVHLPDDAKPIDYFQLTFSQDILDIVVRETNRRGTVTDTSTPSDHKHRTQHNLEPIPDTAKNGTVMRRCKKCANKQIRKQSRYPCPLCPETSTL
ncbi:hypothetical protein JTB14_030404 [Gonioctena quinquepunctata]|nr:hypothetical protein JTB14_030404 [Gonioctena quinquepunctata]